MILKNVLVLFDGEKRLTDVQIEKDTIVKIEQGLKGEGYDLKGGFLTAGGIDCHAHFREPGYTDKGSILTETQSAIKGGIFTAFAMPNLNPTPDSVKNLKVETDAIERDAKITVLPYGSLTKGEKGKELSDLEDLAKKVVAFSDDGKCVNDLGLLKEGMIRAKALNKVIASHAEAEGLGDTPLAEIKAVERELNLAKQTGVKYHFCHLSTAESLSLVKDAKREGIDVTCEVTPHHIAMIALDKTNANFKMNPPLREKKDVLATIEAIVNGVADFIATDHAPHTAIEKALPWEQAPYGIIGFETMYPIVITTLYKTGLMNLTDIERITSKAVAARFGLKAPKIAVGEKATFAVLDLDNKRKYTLSEIKSKSKNSPFIGKEMYGYNKLSVVNGKIEYIDLEEVCQTKF